MRKLCCDLCGKLFNGGVKAGQCKVCTGTIGDLIYGLNICEPCMDKIRMRSGWEQFYLDKLKEEISDGEKQ